MPKNKELIAVYQRMSEDEQPLLGEQPVIPVREERPHEGLTVFQATLSFINLCGVLPIITLPRPVIECGESKINFISIKFIEADNLESITDMNSRY